MNGVIAERPTESRWQRYSRVEPCPTCGVERRVYIYRPSRQCVSCAGKRTIHAAIAANTGKPRPQQSERQRGANNPSWKGGVVRAGNGYLYELVPPDDEFSPMANRFGYAMAHRLVVAKSLRRLLYSWEQVHHRNGNKTDNSIENLELWKRSQPSGVRQSDYHCPGCRCNEVIQ